MVGDAVGQRIDPPARGRERHCLVSCSLNLLVRGAGVGEFVPPLGEQSEPSGPTQLVSYTGRVKKGPQRTTPLDAHSKKLTHVHFSNPPFISISISIFQRIYPQPLRPPVRVTKPACGRLVTWKARGSGVGEWFPHTRPQKEGKGRMGIWGEGIWGEGGLEITRGTTYKCGKKFFF